MQTQLHTVYRNHQGNIIPGVTSINDQLRRNKSTLIGWAKKLVRSGLDPDRGRYQGAEIGTLAHELHAHLMGKQADTAEYGLHTADEASACFLAYCNWQADHQIKTLAAEIQVISEAHQYNGTADLIAEIDGVVSVLDFKTSTHV